MNAGIVSLQDGTPCIVYDEALPYLIDYVEFNEENHQITLVYILPPGVKGKQGMEFPYPLDSDFLEVLRDRGDVAVAFVKNKQLSDITLFSVKFVGA